MKKKIKERIEKIIPSEYHYELPDSRIAKYPLQERSHSKLLIWNRGRITNDSFFNLAQYLEAGTTLVFNDTRVIRARLQFQKSTGALIEIFCLEPLEPATYEQALEARTTCSWKCLTGNLRRWKEGELLANINIYEESILLKASLKKNHGEWQEIIFEWDNKEIIFGNILETAGKTPIPPYLQRASEEIDKQRYQTVYSRFNGSVAAPTAGLHFTDDLLKKLGKKEIDQVKMTLHVGAGTFRPVKTDNLFNHEMHAEHFKITRQALEMVHERASTLTVVGTTCLRMLESLYILGCKARNNELTEPYRVQQWDGFTNETSIEFKESINALLENTSGPLEATTQLIIAPGYQVKSTNNLITNFHQPGSTLLMLVAAFAGKDWEKIYQYALDNDFRFLSYGDSSLLKR